MERFVTRGNRTRPAGAGLRLASIVVVWACGGLSTEGNSDDPPATGRAMPLAIVDVQLVTMRSSTILPHQTVLVREGRIEWTGPMAGRAIPPDATVIQGGGRFLMPALIDMHVHLRSAELERYVENGIATVRNMWGFPEISRWASEIASESRVGPTVVSASQGLDGTPPQWPLTVLVTRPEDARAAVTGQHAAGWRYLKVYSRLSPPAFDSVIVAARDLGMIPIGHVPLAVDVRTALTAGMKSIEHLTGYDRAASRLGRSGTWAWIDADPTRFAELVTATLASGTWNGPTLAIYSELARRQHSVSERETILRNRRLLVKQLWDAGAPLLLGTDAGIDVVAAGTSIHDELDELVAAGLTPYDALRTGTSEAARFLGRADLGIVDAGAEASLLLTRNNPLTDVGALRNLDGVVLRGAWRPAGRR